MTASDSGRPPKVFRARTFSGGFKFRRYAGQPDRQVADLARPDFVRIPLLQGFGVPLAPLVKPGDRVEAGQVIGRDDNTASTPVHATVGGTVRAIESVEHNGRMVDAVAIDADGRDDLRPVPGHATDWHRLSPEQLGELLYVTGVTGLGAEGIPTRFRTSVVNADQVRHVIIHHTGSDAFNPSAEVLLGGERSEQFVGGVSILKRVLPAAQFHIALCADERALIHRIDRLCAGQDRVTVHALSSRYPQDFAEMLVITVLGEPFPFGQRAINIGVVVLDAQAVLHAWEAVTAGRPVIERLIALSGPGFTSPTHVRVRVGTPVEQVVRGRLRDVPVRLIRNSLLSGVEVKDRASPVMRTDTQLVAAPAGAERVPAAFARPGLHRDSWSRAFLARVLPLSKQADTNLHGDERPCVNCGYCARVCPVRIVPQLIFRIARRIGVSERLVNYNVFNCIDCNLCTFVCPSKIPVARHMKETKERLLEVGCDNSSCILPKFDLRGIEDYKGVKSVR